MNGTSA